MIEWTYTWDDKYIHKFTWIDKVLYVKWEDKTKTKFLEVNIELFDILSNKQEYKAPYKKWFIDEIKKTHKEEKVTNDEINDACKLK